MFFYDNMIVEKTKSAILPGSVGSFIFIRVRVSPRVQYSRVRCL